jgi:catechol 2,3-dioxygenase-like lactoylglutathione lyase family enzyme
LNYFDSNPNHPKREAANVSACAFWIYNLIEKENHRWHHRIFRRNIMLGRFHIRTTIPAGDLDRARRFYAEKLGLQPASEAGDGLVYELPGSSFLLYPTSYAGTAQHTIAEWMVEDLDAVMAEMRSRGAVFEDYDYPTLKTVNGVADIEGQRVAWFKDSEGNILALTEVG